jgi:hypothetical protein
MDTWESYMNVHVIFQNKFCQVAWNLFRKPYKDYGIKFYNLYYEYSFAIFFGIGEFWIDINKPKTWELYKQ